MSTKPRRRVRWPVRLLALALALPLALLLAEIAVRATGLAPHYQTLEVTVPWGTFETSPNPDLGYVPRPGSGDISAYGIRDRDYPLRKPEDAYRIVVIGDSIGYGLCIDSLEDTFPKVLEEKLNGMPGRGPVEVINLCVPGYDTTQQVEFLREKGLALAPDLVIVSFCLNDYGGYSTELAHLRGDPRWRINDAVSRQARQNLLYRSHLVRLVVQRAPVLHRQVKRFGARPEPTDAAQVDAPEDSVQAGFRELRQMADRHGFEMLVTIFPVFKDFDDYRFIDLHEKTAAHAASVGFESLDLLAPYLEAAAGDPASLSCDPQHPNVPAHALAASVLAEHLEATFLRAGP